MRVWYSFWDILGKQEFGPESTGAYILFYQGAPIDHWTHVTGPVAQSISESDYNAACTAGMALEYFRMLKK